MGCASHYAVLKITAINETNGSPIYSKIYSGNSLQFIGETPSLNYLIFKEEINTDGYVSLICEADCYKTTWINIKVTKWVKDKKEAYNAENLNTVLFKLRSETCKNNE